MSPDVSIRRCGPLDGFAGAAHPLAHRPIGEPFAADGPCLQASASRRLRDLDADNDQPRAGALGDGVDRLTVGFDQIRCVHDDRPALFEEPFDERMADAEDAPVLGGSEARLAGETEADGVGLDDLRAARPGEPTGQIGLAVAGKAGQQHQRRAQARSRCDGRRGVDQGEVGFDGTAGDRRHGARRAR